MFPLWRPNRLIIRRARGLLFPVHLFFSRGFIKAERLKGNQGPLVNTARHGIGDLHAAATGPWALTSVLSLSREKLRKDKVRAWRGRPANHTCETYSRDIIAAVLGWIYNLIFHVLHPKFDLLKQRNSGYSRIYFRIEIHWEIFQMAWNRVIKI